MELIESSKEFRPPEPPKTADTRIRQDGVDKELEEELLKCAAEFANRYVEQFGEQFLCSARVGTDTRTPRFMSMLRAARSVSSRRAELCRSFIISQNAQTNKHAQPKPHPHLMRSARLEIPRGLKF